MVAVPVAGDTFRCFVQSKNICGIDRGKDIDRTMTEGVKSDVATLYIGMPDTCSRSNYAGNTNLQYGLITGGQVNEATFSGIDLIEMIIV